MRLKRNITKDGSCKYSLIEHEKGDHIEHGLPGTENEFFVIKLKDKYALKALRAYALAAHEDENFSYAEDIDRLADRSGEHSKWCKKPD